MEKHHGFRCTNTKKPWCISPRKWWQMSEKWLILHNCSLHFRLCRNSSPLLFFSVAVLTVPLTSSAHEDCGYEESVLLCCFSTDKRAGCRNFKITVGLLTQTLQASRRARLNVFGSVKKRKKRRRIRPAEEGGSKEKRGWLERMYS